MNASPQKNSSSGPPAAFAALTGRPYLGMASPDRARPELARPGFAVTASGRGIDAESRAQILEACVQSSANLAGDGEDHRFLPGRILKAADLSLRAGETGQAAGDL